MPKIISLDKFTRADVDLHVYENIHKEGIHRIFFLTNLKEESIRGGNTCRNAYEGLICIKGYCEVKVLENEIERIYTLNSPDICLMIEPNEWHEIINFDDDTILLAFSNKKYNELEMY